MMSDLDSRVPKCPAESMNVCYSFKKVDSAVKLSSCTRGQYSSYRSNEVIYVLKIIQPNFAKRDTKTGKQ